MSKFERKKSETDIIENLLLFSDYLFESQIIVNFFRTTNIWKIGKHRMEILKTK